MNYGTKYAKGLVAEVSEFLFGSGFAIAEGSLWTARRRAVVPSLHKKYLSVIVDRVFCKCSQRFVEKVKLYALNDTDVNMDPVIESVYTTLTEAEARSTDFLSYWKGAYNGARQLEVTINGIRERAGNASLEEVEKYSGLMLQPHKPIVGVNAFAHESGMHQVYKHFLKQPGSAKRKQPAKRNTR
ncbi:hypothetical protein L2E82_48758 [Cichorium intybus]|uniref:Uncharacterized protein n=1 Tax=Cichorium intybus TaxID=13427 RepID=A0ACB8YYW4_CICIN|nr:hypothetical protein L2E82_48758 [Cichorium intybus]